MALYTNKGLVKHAEKALALNTKYMWGGILKPITTSYIKALRGIYNTTSGTGYTEDRYAELSKYAEKGGYYGCDCVGLIKSYYWSGKADGGTGSPNNPYSKPENAKLYPDTNAGGMYATAKVKGKISTLPERPGVIVYCKTHPHVGIYIGNGWVIECTLSGRGDGVVKTKLSDFAWEYWFECPYIEYANDAPAVTSSTTTTAATKKITFAFKATVRAKPSVNAARLGSYSPGQTATIIVGSEKTDSESGYTYVRISGDTERWVVKSAIKG